eukprot:TRINITY_DN8229_c0_g1_i2.p1 TRINITY_DN8229_c0_g1~~TRINITY_DN8229_c0_g1_i2.p1  ORF type:complete len:105 (+),score=9.56 TRINITY_DN8229_c0_g1_i2:153-467(+)
MKYGRSGMVTTGIWMIVILCKECIASDSLAPKLHWLLRFHSNGKRRLEETFNVRSINKRSADVSNHWLLRFQGHIREDFLFTKARYAKLPGREHLQNPEQKKIR